MISLVVYVPDSHVEQVKNALFDAGAGRLGQYDRCAWQTEGTGQFRPLAGADPFVGEEGKIERVKEWKIEMVCERALVSAAIAALKKSHPYETPAYHFTETFEA